MTDDERAQEINRQPKYYAVDEKTYAENMRRDRERHERHKRDAEAKALCDQRQRMAFSFMNNFDQTLSNWTSRRSVDEIRFSAVNLHGALYYRCAIACGDDSEYQGGSRTSVFEAFQNAVEKYNDEFS